MDVLRNTLQPGDEVAIRPGKTHLSYRGKHTPVTDMVYMAYGLGIVPVLDQVRAITPRGSSTVVVSSVTWFNSVRDDFDLAMDDLEYEYMKYPGKLAVSCILEDVLTNPLEGNVEVEESVPYFNPGTMAVICGPKRFTEKARGYLMRRGYPENCICILP
jgi:ferredoxin-NADP reductase